MNTLRHVWPFAWLFVAAALANHAVAQAPVRLTSNSGPGSRHPVVALDADVVVYVAIANGVRDLWSVATDGSAPIRLTTGADVRVGAGNLDLWSPLSISDDAGKITWWNAQGVHVFDRRSHNDVVVATASLLPFPQLDGDGSRVVFQAPVNGDLEVFVVPSDGSAPPVQVTTSSGAGRRLPHLRAGKVVFQKLVGAQMEVFVRDLAAGTTAGPLTTGSGAGNRHARLTPDAEAIVYEAVGPDFLTPMRLSLAGGAPVTLAVGSSGARLPLGDSDGQVVLQATATAPEVWLFDPALLPFTSASRGGQRQPSLDRHGQVLVWQLEYLGRNEVFAVRRCWPVWATNWGAGGQPSAGALTPFFKTWRCQQSIGLHTQLAAGTIGLWVLGNPQLVSLTPLGAPGNWSLVTIGSWQVLAIDAMGDLTHTFPLSPALLQSRLFGQFAIFDAAANALGLVTSRGFDTIFP